MIDLRVRTMRTVNLFRTVSALFFLVASMPAMQAAPRSLVDPLRENFISVEPRPQYPFEAKRLYLSGSGVYRAYINANGKVTAVGVVKSSGHRILDEAVVQAAIRWKAKPGRKREVDFPATFVTPPRKAPTGGIS